MNIKRLCEFMVDKTIFPGYYAKEGMKFVSYRGRNPQTHVGMEVIKTDDANVFIRDNKNEMEFPIPRKEIKAQTIVRVKHGT